MPMPKLIPRLYVYYVVHDKGVAPNPDGDMLTLALCKKDISVTARFRKHFGLQSAI
jgi:hypothetical protein